MSPYRMSEIEAGIRTVIEFGEAFNRHDAAAIMQLLSEECLLEDFEPAPDGMVYEGREAVTSFWQDYFYKRPEAHIEIEEVSGLRERCVMRWKLSWTDETGKDHHVRGVDLFKVRDGAIREQLSYVKA